MNNSFFDKIKFLTLKRPFLFKDVTYNNKKPYTIKKTEL